MLLQYLHQPHPNTNTVLKIIDAKGYRGIHWCDRLCEYEFAVLVVGFRLLGLGEGLVAGDGGGFVWGVELGDYLRLCVVDYELVSKDRLIILILAMLNFTLLIISSFLYLIPHHNTILQRSDQLLHLFLNTLDLL